MTGRSCSWSQKRQGFKRSDIMKAKAELGVRIQTTGYGKNVKAWWSLKEENHG